MPLPVTGLVVDLLGFLTGTALYVMLIAMVWRERAGEHQSLWTRRGRLPLLTGLCGLVWNVGALMSFGSLAHGSGRSGSLVLALSFSALGFLPAVVVHALLEGRETVAGRGVTRAATAAAYGLSTTAAVMQVLAVMQARPVPSPPALWLLTGGFAVLSALLLLVTRQQPIGRRGVWVAALSLFAVSALHFGRHVGNESWGTELLGHHASLLLALAILHQDYRFALADLFLKNAIAVLLLMGVSLATLSGAVVPLLSLARCGWCVGSASHRRVPCSLDGHGAAVPRHASIGRACGRSRRVAETRLRRDGDTSGRGPWSGRQ